MKIAVTVDKPERTAPLSDFFGRCGYILIHDMEKGNEEFISNPFATELGGAGIQLAKLLIENNIDVVIVKKIGLNPFRFVTSAKIKVYQCSEGTADEALRLFSEGKLFLMENIDKSISLGRKHRRRGKQFLDNMYKNSKKE
ncbi:MAG: NifB/NifX family molybdenum-iron cluster-binding protein [bacterium]